jgi:cyanate permease
MFMYISSATPDKRLLGALNGLSQTVGAFQRAVGPAIAGSLFAFSVTNNILGGNFVYVVLFMLVGIGLYFAAKLPKGAWRHGGR